MKSPTDQMAPVQVVGEVISLGLEWAVQRPDAPRILEWFVPKEGVGPEQELALGRVVEDGARLGVEVKLFRVAA